MNKKVSISNYVYKILIRRLVVASILLLVIVASYSYWQNVSNFKKQINVIVEDRLALLRHQILLKMDKTNESLSKVIQQALIEQENVGFSRKSGFFIYANIINKSSDTFVNWYNKGYNDKALLDQYIKNNLSTIHVKPDKTYSQFITVGENRALIYIKPVYGSADNFLGQLKTIYILSPEMNQELIYKILYAFLFGVLLIATMIGIIYPVVIRLTAKLGKSYTDVLDANLEMMALLGAAIAKRDSDTSAHNYRVTLISVRLAVIPHLPH